MDVYTILLYTNDFRNELREILVQYANGYVSGDSSPISSELLLPVLTSLKLSLITPQTQDSVCWTCVSGDSVSAGVERVIAGAGVAQHADLHPNTGTAFQQDNDAVTAVTERAALCIAKLSGDLPANGCYVHVLWVSEDGAYPAVREHLSLFGALRHIVDSHPCHVSLVTPVEEEAAGEWLTHLCGAVATRADVGEMGRGFIWHGSIKISDTQGSSPLLLPGFTLLSPVEEDSPLASPRPSRPPPHSVRLEAELEFLTEVSVSAVPPLYHTPHRLKLVIRSSSALLAESRELLASLRDQANLGYLVRVAQLDLASGRRLVHHLLLVARPEMDGPSRCVAHVLRCPATLSPAVARLIAEPAPPPVRPDTTRALDKVDAMLDSLPRFTTSQLVAVQHAVEQAQVAALRDVGDVVTFDDLWLLLANVRESIMAESEAQAPRGCAARDRADVVSLPAEYLAAWSSSLERAALVVRAEHDKRLRRIKSEECIGGLTPPVASTSSTVLKLDVSDLLRHFRGDGTAAAAELEPVRGRRYAGSDAHDVYYNQGDFIDKQECVCDKMKARLLGVETQATCSYAEAKLPATITLISKRNAKFTKSKPGSLQIADSRTRTPSKVKPMTRLTPCKARHSVLTPRSRRAIKLKGRLAASASPRKHTLTPKKQKTLASGVGTLRNESKSILKQDQTNAKTSVKPTSCPAKTPDAPVTTLPPSSVASQPTTSVIAQHKASRAAQMTSAERQARLSRSQRHKKKLEEVVAAALTAHGVVSSDPLFGACAQRLFALVKVFVKDLATSHNLREEMARLAAAHVLQCVEFEKTKAKK